VQPSRRKRRQIGTALRPERPLRYEGLSDPILVRRAKDGDNQALETLCVRHAPRVNRLSAHVLGDPEDARDAAQEALAKVCVKLGQFRGEAAFSTWLHRLTLNACKDVAQRRARRQHDPLVDDARAGNEPEPDRSAELSELRADLREGFFRQDPRRESGFPGVVGEDVPRAEDEIFQLGQWHEVFDQRRPAFGSLSEANGPHLRQRSDWRRKPAADGDDAGDRRGADSSESNEENSQLSTCYINLRRIFHNRKLYHLKLDATVATP